MKRIISCLLIFVMLAVAIPASAAEKPARLVLDAPYGVIGEELAVEIRAEDLDNCSIFGLDLQYDPAVLTAIDFVEGTNGYLTFADELKKGQYAIVWADPEKPLKGDVVFGTLKFEVIKNVNSTELKVGKVEIASESEMMEVVYEEPIIPLYENYTFTDITADWYKEAVLFAYNNNLMNGVGNNKFDPDSATTRAMLAAILYRHAGEPEVNEKAPFTDLSLDWYKGAVNWAHKNEIVEGMGENIFAPDKNVTREQIATMMYRYAAKYDKKDVSQKKSLTSFPDSKKVSSWAKEAMEWAYAEGLITGNFINGTVFLDPQGAATRAQIATILMRYVKMSAEQ